MEEAGIRVKNIQYYKSQPWGVVDDLLAGFYCEVDGDTEIHMDASELKLAEWKSRDEIELQPNDFSLTNEMMRAFKEGKFQFEDGNYWWNIIKRDHVSVRLLTHDLFL